MGECARHKICVIKLKRKLETGFQSISNMVLKSRGEKTEDSIKRKWRRKIGGY